MRENIMDHINAYIKDQLHASSRPGYPSRKVTQAEVNEWMENEKRKGIRTIICLLDDRQLGYYTNIPDGLLETYRKNGFVVLHYPIPDPVYDYNGWNKLDEIKEKIYQDYLAAPKPVLVHCSAGEDRTGAVVRYIRSRSENR